MWKNIHTVGIVLVGLIIFALGTNFEKNKGYQMASREATIYDPIVVLELFTSQGCSSCPSADLLLQKVKRENNKEVFALSYHVDYWNYIGWTDPFSKPEHTKKQRKYNIKFRNNSNYTPQLVVNGKEHFVGSNSSKIDRTISAYKKKKSANEVHLKDVTVTKKKISFEYDIKGGINNKRLKILLVLDERTTKVKRGENSNRTLQNANIVIEQEQISIENVSGLAEISIPKIVNDGDKLNLIVLVENLEYDITGASKKSLIRSK